ncbi:hypothetical protein STBHUCCB_p1580 (plasmid) [Salmonella enterica subsp. enterica serovar Typhi str. P-stx-12]|nr:hypothetical protein [Escherichia coli]AEZ48607.1 hypothetical protein STBHUCCB_p1580 [Salmonella enterica subsp. enterica serovar Typhi str. P-stx-12]ESD35078.1 hypothetical protein HMPREF1604_04590 [Escherichia coli 908519]
MMLGTKKRSGIRKEIFGTSWPAWWICLADDCGVVCDGLAP